MDRDTLQIRRYEAVDHPDILRLHEAALRDVGAYVEDKGWDEDLRDIETNYLEDGEFLVGLYRRRLVVMGVLRKTGLKRAEIKRMRVESGFQGRGFGQAILSALEGRAAERGYTTLHLDTTVNRRLRGVCTPETVTERPNAPGCGLSIAFSTKRRAPVSGCYLPSPSRFGSP